MKPMKQQSFLQGAGILALATIVGIALSLIFKLISVLRPEEVVLDAVDSEEVK